MGANFGKGATHGRGREGGEKVITRLGVKGGGTPREGEWEWDRPS